MRLFLWRLYKRCLYQRLCNDVRHYCLTGVFMEHMIAENLVGHGYYPQSRRDKWYALIDEFEELCRSYDGENATACWTEMIHPASIKFRGDPQQIFDFCNTAQVEEGAKRCRRHSVVEILAEHDYDISSLKYMCAIKQSNDPAFERDCYRSLVAVTLFHVTPEEATDVVDFCLTLDRDFQDSCFSQIGRILGELGTSRDNLVTICSNAPDGFKDECIGKAG